MIYLDRLRKFSNTPDSEAAKAAEPPFAGFAGTESGVSENFSARATSPDLVFYHEGLAERAAILEHEAGMSREQADAQALSATTPRSLSVAEAVRGRVWRVTLHDGTTCTVIMPEAMTLDQAKADILRGPLGHRVLRVDAHHTT
jgi:hypothetical protein